MANTVIASTDRLELAEEALNWATSTYDQVVKRYGTKADLYKANGNGAGETVPMCTAHQVPMVKVEGRKGPFWSCHQKDDQGNWCSYKVNGQ